MRTLTLSQPEVEAILVSDVTTPFTIINTPTHRVLGFDHRERSECFKLIDLH